MIVSAIMSALKHKLVVEQGICKVVTSRFVSLRNRRFLPVEAISSPHLGIASSLGNAPRNDTGAVTLNRFQAALQRQVGSRFIIESGITADKEVFLFQIK